MLGFAPAIGFTAEEHKPSFGLVDAKVFAGPNDSAAQPVDEALMRPTAATEFTVLLARLAGEINRARTLTIFEGHPRLLDRTAAAAEHTRKPSFKRLGESFYAAPLEATDELDRNLRRLVLQGVKVSRGVKLCGGFHADFLLRWQGPAGEAEALLCFGCHEVKIVGIGGALYADLSAEQVDALRKLLNAYFATESIGTPTTPTNP